MSDPCQTVISDLENHSSRLNKEQILEAEAEANNQELFEGIRFCLDNLTTFGVKKVPTHGGPDGQGLPWVAFKELCNLLSTRQLTGDDARTAIELALSASTKRQWNDWYRRILIKDLRCGASEKTVNKVVEKRWPHFSVPVFSCQLAHDSANHESKVTGNKLIEVKLDGVRVITVVYPDGKVDQYSRNGKELHNFKTIMDEIAKMGYMLNEPVVLDGEIMSANFQDLMKQARRKENAQTQDAVLNLFDMLSLDEFKAGVGAYPQSDRSALLSN